MAMVLRISEGEGKITAAPLDIFNGEIFEYKLQLSNSFENFFNLIKIEDILRQQDRWSIFQMTNMPNFGNQFQITGEFLHLYDSASKLYNIYNLQAKNFNKLTPLLNNTGVLVETVCPGSSELPSIYRNFYLSHGYVLLVYKNNDIQISEHPQFAESSQTFSNKIDYKERIYEAKGFIEGNLITIFAKTNPFEVNFSVVLLLRLTKNFATKEIKISLLNSQFQKITYQQIVVLNLSNNEPVIIHTTQNKGLLFNFLPDVSSSKSGSIITSRYVPIYALFKNEEIIINLIEKFDKAKLKCFNHKSLPEDTKSVYVTCISMLTDWDFVKVSFKFIYSADLEIHTLAFNLIENFPIALKEPCSFRKAVISDKFIVTAFITNKRLTLYVYNAPVAEIKNKPNLFTLNLFSKNIKGFPNQIDFCDKNINDRFMKPFKRHYVDVNADKLDYFELVDERLEFIANNEIYRYHIYSQIVGSLKKHNLISKQIILSASIGDKKALFVQDNTLFADEQAGKFNSIQGSENHHAGMRNAVLDCDFIGAVQARSKNAKPTNPLLAILFLAF